MEYKTVDGDPTTLWKLVRQEPDWAEARLRLVEPVSVKDRLPPPGQKVLATFLNSMGKRRTICCHHLPKLFMESAPDTETEIEWDDDEETAYYVEGWYENIENWDDYSFIAVCEGTIDYWLPLPSWPEEE